MQQAIQDCRDGVISFDVFVRKTFEDWRRIARMLLRRWLIPVGVFGEEDLVQELLLAAWRAIQKYDPLRGGMSLHSYVVYASIAKGKKAMHRIRKARRCDDKEPSRLTIPVSSLSREGEDPLDIADLLIAESDQEERYAVAHSLERLESIDRLAVTLYVHRGSRTEAAWGLLEQESGLTYRQAQKAIDAGLGALVEDRAWDLLADQSVRESLGIATLPEACQAILSM